MDYRLILHNPHCDDLPDWASPVATYIDGYDLFVTCTIEIDLELAEAIALLTQSGFEVWALEYKNTNWISKRL